jgi:endonuclease I
VPKLPERSLPLAGLSGLIFVFSAVAAAQAPPGYYSSVDTSSAAALRSTLHEVIDDHQRFPYTSSATDTWDILEMAQEDPSNSGNIITIYRNDSDPKQGGGNSIYNREHVWPRSYGIPDDVPSNYPFTDCHMLRLADPSYNSSRGNRPFQDCNAGCTQYATTSNNGVGGMGGGYPGDSNWGSGSGHTGTWEVWNERRGDIARILFYMDMRYEGGTHGVTMLPEANLELTDDISLLAASNTGNNESPAYMGHLSLLLQWHAEDPPDAFEMNHTDVVFGFQGNRNPYVDHPEWVDVVYGVAPPPPPLQGLVWINELHYDNDGVDTGEAVEIAGPDGTDLSGFSVVAYNGSGGASYSTLNLSGLLPDTQGGIGILDFAFAGLQNGSPDGLALVDDMGGVLEFISYEGSFTASDGPAMGMDSTDIGVLEVGPTPVGDSLQRGGTGVTAVDFAWQMPLAETRGDVNANQTFGLPCPTASATSRNSGFNPASFTADPPVLGQPWTASVDVSTTGSNFAFILSRKSPFMFTLLTGQVLLVDLGSSNELLGLAAQAGPVAMFNSMIPSDVSFCGFEASLQAVHFGGAGNFFLSNAMDLIAGQ